MRLHRLGCRFGRLEGDFRFADDRLTLVIEDNEQGKTTLAEAILAALYGFERLGSGPEERRRFLPLAGGAAFVELELTSRSRRLLVRREFPSPGEETARITDAASRRDVTREFLSSRNPTPLGERLLGLTREQFLRTCFVRHGQVSDVRAGANLAERV